MRSDPALAALRDIAHHIELATGFVAGMSFEAFRDDLRTFHAVTRCLEIISEASRRLPNDLKARHPAIAWREMAGAGKCLPPRLRGRGRLFRVGHGAQSPAAPARRHRR